MADDKTILLKVELDVSELQKAQKVAATTVKDLIAKKKELNAAEDKDTIAIAKNAAELRKANKTLKDTTNALQVNERQNKSNTGSLTEMREALAAAKTGYALLSEESRKSEAGVKTAEDMLKLKNAINEIEQSFGTFTGSVGNYEGANKKLTKTLEDVKNGLIPLAKGASILDDQMEALRKEGKENTKEFRELEKAQESLDEETKKLAGDMEYLGKDILVEVSGSISKMEDRLYEMALAGDTTSKEFIELQEQTAKYKKVVIETDKSIDAMAESGKGLSSALALSETVVAGYQAYTGVTAILGEENEALLETITKLQAAQGVLNSIQIIRQKLQENSIRITQLQAGAQRLLNKAIGEGSKASKVFRGALLATGIGLIILAVTELIANFDKLKGMFVSVNDQQKLNNETMHAATEAIADELSAANKLQKTLKDETLTREQKRKAVIELQNQYPSLLGNIDAEKDSLEDVNKALSLNVKLARLKAQSDAIAELRAEKFKNIINEQTDAITGNNVGFLDQAQAYFKNFEAANLFGAKITDVNKQQKIASDARNKANKDSLETVKTTQREIDALDNLDKSIDEQINSLMLLGASDKEYQKDQDKNTRKTDRQTESIKRQTFAILERVKVSTESTAKLSANLDKEFEADKKRLEVLAAIDVAETQLFGTREAQTEARIRQIEVERDNELKNLELTEAERVKIKLESELKIRAIREESTQHTADQAEKESQILTDAQAKNATIALNFAQQTASALVQIKQNQIQAELNLDKEKYDTQSQLLTDQLESGFITQAEFDAKKSDLDAKAKAKEKKLKEEAFKADRNAKLISAGINIALGVTSALTIPPPAGVVLAGVTAALGAIELAAIASAPTPKFKKGGIFGGKSHENGGTKGYFDDGTQIEVEKDEHFVIVNKNAKGLMSQLDYINQSTGGVPLMSGGGVMKFQGGGVAISEASKSGNNAFNQSQQLNAALMNMPPIYVAVQDINTGQGQYADVVQRSDF